MRSIDTHGNGRKLLREGCLYVFQKELATFMDLLNVAGEFFEEAKKHTHPRFAKGMKFSKQNIILKQILWQPMTHLNKYWKQRWGQ